MNAISFKLEIVPEKQTVEYDGIGFSNCYFVRCLIDGEVIHEKKAFRDSVIVIDELKKSINGNGFFLIFVCACGVADDGGWKKVKVTHEANVVKWQIRRGSLISFEFDKTEYFTEVASILNKIKMLDKTIEVEPKSVVWPEKDS